MIITCIADSVPQDIVFVIRESQTPGRQKSMSAEAANGGNCSVRISHLN